jgi:hypothetical protein
MEELFLISFGVGLGLLAGSCLMLLHSRVFSSRTIFPILTSVGSVVILVAAIHMRKSDRNALELHSVLMVKATPEDMLELAMTSAARFGDSGAGGGIVRAGHADNFRARFASELQNFPMGSALVWSLKCRGTLISFGFNSAILRGYVPADGLWIAPLPDAEVAHVKNITTGG